MKYEIVITYDDSESPIIDIDTKGSGIPHLLAIGIIEYLRTDLRMKSIAAIQEGITLEQNKKSIRGKAK